MGAKSHDFCGCYGCSQCHDILDGRRKTAYDRETLRHYFNEAMKKSLIRLWEMKVKIW